ncbi:MAG: 6-pyruvoyl-tetrahydropterin synthase-related protein [Patescibacteria group bacterium]|mgnify:CR=1 FL=1
MILKNKFFLIGLILSAGLLWPLFAAPYFKHHDDVSPIRLFEMDKCIKDGQIPCRWVPDLGGLYGYPIFNYYAPLPYYFGEVIYVISKNLIFSSKVIFAVSFLGSYVFMYLLARKFWGRQGGALSAIFYSFAPYHALDFYVRGAMGEMWALMFFPAIFWAFVKLKEQTSISNMLLVTICTSGLILSHNLSTMIFLPIMFLWILILFFKDKGMRFLYFSFLSLLLGVTISAFYTLPMVFEKNLVHIDTTTYGYFGYTEHFKGIKELFIKRDWGYGSSIREVPGAEQEKISFQIGWIHLLGWVLTLFCIKFFWKKNPWVARVILVLSSAALFAIFMVHPRSEFIWNMVDPLKYLQFPWRFLLIIIFLISFVTGASCLALRGKSWLTKLWIIIIFLTVTLNFSYFRPEEFINITNQELLSGENWDKQIKRSIFDYLPIYAKEPPAELAKARFQILTGDAEIRDFQEGTNRIKFKADVLSHTIIRLSQYFFPNWKVFVDGKEVSVEYKNNSLGLMTIILGKGQHEVEARLFDTQIRVIANWLTLLGLFLFVSLLLIQFKQVRKWASYYIKAIS